jgi:hypothetical protein
MKTQGLARSYLFGRLPQEAADVFSTIDRQLDYGLDWQWIDGREIITLRGLQRAGEEFERHGCPAGAAVVRGELATLQREIAAAVPMCVCANGERQPYWWQRGGME